MMLMMSIFIASLFAGYGDLGWLIGMSIVVVWILVNSLREALPIPRFLIVILFVFLIHVAVSVFLVHEFPLVPAKAFSPLFFVDYIAMWFAVPKLSGLTFQPSE